MLNFYEEPLFRPPAEAYSLIFQVTIGCSWNKCAFCEMYSTKKFRIKNDQQIIEEIKYASKLYPETRKIFLADGNAMVLSFNKLKTIINCIKEFFPKINRISTYALPNDIISKTDNELKELKELGLSLIYVGIESGDDFILNINNKSETFKSTVMGLLKAKNAGIKSSVMILSGLGGQKHSYQHAINSAKLINEVQPEFLSTLVLSYPFKVDHYKKRLNYEFTPLNINELLVEQKLFIEALELNSTIFRSDHASNYLTLKGILNKDKGNILQIIQSKIDNPINLREEWMRGL